MVMECVNINIPVTKSCRHVVEKQYQGDTTVLGGTLQYWGNATAPGGHYSTGGTLQYWGNTSVLGEHYSIGGTLLVNK